MAPCHGYCCGDCSAKGNTRKYLKKNYNISYEFYMEMYAKFDGMCHICRSKGFKIDANQRLNLVVDHCHITGLVRGMLCHNCNRALELFQDNTQFLNNAVEYLERATTILNGSTLLAIGSGSAQHPEMGDDIV